jgi:hypothetical protein
VILAPVRWLGQERIFLLRLDQSSQGRGRDLGRASRALDMDDVDIMTAFLPDLLPDLKAPALGNPTILRSDPFSGHEGDKQCPLLPAAEKCLPDFAGGDTRRKERSTLFCRCS